jgi:acyl-coenzyme A synthetase/AMP-(fatty) acid ligase
MTDFNAAHWLVDRHVDEGRGDRVAIRCQGRSTTYADLQQRVWRAQRLLAGLGIEPGERVTMVVRDDEAFPAFFLGALRAGIVPVPLSTMLKGPALGDIVADAGARALVVSDVFADAVADVLAAAPSLEHAVVCGDASARGAATST